MASFADYQHEVYLNGLADETPAFPVGWRDLEAAAYAAMTPDARGYVGGGSGGEETMRANREAFDRWRIVPRMLRGIPAQRDLSTTVLGTPMPAPVMLGPVGVLEIVHPDAERAVARAAAALRLPMVLSTAASTAMEEVAEVGGPRLVPAVLAEEPRAGGVLRAARREGRLRGDRVHRRHVAARLAAARPRRGVPAVPEGRRDRELPDRPGVPGPAGQEPGGGPRGGRPALVGAVHQPVADVGRPRLAARADLAADRAQGRAAPGRRAPRRRRRRCRASSAATTAAARSTARSARSTRCPASSRPPGTCRCCSTAASAPARMR